MTVLFKMLASTADELFGLTDAGHVYLLNAERTGWTAVPNTVLGLPGVPNEGLRQLDYDDECKVDGCHELVRAPGRFCRAHRLQGA